MLVIILVATITASILLVRNNNRQLSTVEKFRKLKENANLELEQVKKKTERENLFIDSLSALIQNGNSENANILVNKWLTKYPDNNQLIILKGDIFAIQTKYDSSIYEYTIPIVKDSSPIAFNKRSMIYFKIGKYQKAISDLQNAYQINYDYSIKLAELFEKINLKDSALKYYKIYFHNYSDDSIVRKKIFLLEK